MFSYFACTRILLPNKLCIVWYTSISLEIFAFFIISFGIFLEERVSLRMLSVLEIHTKLSNHLRLQGFHRNFLFGLWFSWADCCGRSLLFNKLSAWDVIFCFNCLHLQFEKQILCGHLVIQKNFQRVPFNNLETFVFYF